jgi:YHS domain-containing protein
MVTMEAHRLGSVLALLIAALLVSLPGSAAAGSPGSAVPAVNATDGIGLRRYDPVAYFAAGKPTKGAEAYSVRWQGVTYRFASPENLKTFQADPEKYLPQYGGYCAYAMSLNRIADADPSRWAIVGGKLYLNNGYLAQSLWSLNKSGNIASGDRNWPAYPKKAIGE